MKIEPLRDSLLFEGINLADIELMLGCVDARDKVFYKGETIIYPGSPVKNIGVVLSGKVEIVKENFSGKRFMLQEVNASGVFGEVFAYIDGIKSPVSVISATDSEILFLNYGKMTTTCSSSCTFHQRLIRNMLKQLASQCLVLNKKIDYLMIKSLRERITLFLNGEFTKSRAREFSIPFNREELADYLGVERSALSRELGRMKDDGLIDFQKNRFVLLADIEQ